MRIEIQKPRIYDREEWGEDDGEGWKCLTTETIKSTALALESVDNIEGCDGLALGVLSVGNSIADDTLEEGL